MADKTNVTKKMIALIETYSPVRYSVLLGLPIFGLIVGFFIWNIYLSSLGFFEDELLRAKFILSGFLFFFVTLFLWLLLRIVFKILFCFKKEKIKIPQFLFPLLGILWLMFYTIFLFPVLPNFIGGGQPRSLSLIAEEDNLKILNSLEIKLAGGATYQTENLCITHENSRTIYILRENRILALDKSLIQGFGSLPGIKSINEQMCIEYAQSWSRQGLIFSFILFRTSFTNLFRSILGKPEIYFDAKEL